MHRPNRLLRTHTDERGGITLALVTIILLGLYRIAPHPVNFAPVGAMAFLGGLYLGRRYALFVPIAVLALSDILLNVKMGYGAWYWSRLLDYFAFFCVGCLGLVARSRSVGFKIGSGVLTPVLFFLISNFGVWLFGLDLKGAAYAKTAEGLVACYTAALPFFRATFVGDVVFILLFLLALYGARLYAAKPVTSMPVRSRSV